MFVASRVNEAGDSVVVRIARVQGVSRGVEPALPQRALDKWSSRRTSAGGSPGEWCGPPWSLG